MNAQGRAGWGFWSRYEGREWMTRLFPVIYSLLGFSISENGILSNTQTRKHTLLTLFPSLSRCSPLASPDYWWHSCNQMQQCTNNWTPLVFLPSWKVLLPWHPGVHIQLLRPFCRFSFLCQASRCQSSPGLCPRHCSLSTFSLGGLALSLYLNNIYIWWLSNTHLRPDLFPKQ